MWDDQGGSARGGVAPDVVVGVDGALHDTPPDRSTCSRSRTALRSRWRRVQDLDRPERGSVTAEVAVVLPALVLLTGLLLGVAHVGVLQLRVDEAARAGAREAMRGESDTSVLQTVQRLAGDGATASVESGDGWTTVQVRAEVVGPVVDLMDIELVASASGKEETNG